MQIEYVDLADQESQDQYAEVFTLAQERDLAYPLVAIDGQLRMTGSAHYYHILPLVQQALQVEEVTQ